MDKVLLLVVEFAQRVVEEREQDPVEGAPSKDVEHKDKPKQRVEEEQLLEIIFLDFLVRFDVLGYQKEADAHDDENKDIFTERAPLEIGVVPHEPEIARLHPDDVPLLRDYDCFVPEVGELEAIVGDKDDRQNLIDPRPIVGGFSWLVLKLPARPAAVAVSAIYHDFSFHIIGLVHLVVSGFLSF